MATKEELQDRIAELEESQMQFSALYQISRDLSAAQDEEELLQILAWPTVETEAFIVSLVYIDLDEAGDPSWAKVIASWQRNGASSLITKGAHYYLPDFPLAQLWLADPYEPQLIADVATDERVGEEAEALLSQDDVQALAVIPLSQAERWVGLALLCWNSPHGFDEQETEIYRALAGLISPVVQTRRLLVKRERAVFETLYEISSILNTASDEKELLLGLARPAMEAGASRATLVYFNADDSGDLEWMDVQAVWQRQGEAIYPVGTRFYASDSPICRPCVTALDEPLLITDVNTETRLDDDVKDMLLQQGSRAAVFVPLSQAGKRIGMLCLTWEAPREFSRHEVEIYYALVGIAGPSVRSRRLSKMTQARVRELAVLNELGQELTTRLNVRGVLREAYAQASRLVDADNFYMALYNPEKNEIHLVIDVVDGKLTLPNAIWKNRSGFPECVVRLRQPVLAQDTYADWLAERQEGVYQRISFSELGVRIPLSVLGVPLVVGDRVLGMMAIRDYDDPQAYTKHDQDLLTAIASQTAIALQNAQLFDNLEQMVEERTAELRMSLEKRERLQQEIIDAQQHAIQELSTPIIPLMDRIIVMPLVGSIDSMRARDITRALLAGIREHRAKVVILDITGVPMVDSGVASHLTKTIHAARLKGAQTIVTGISDAVAETIIDLGIDWGNIETLANLQTGLRMALARMGKRIVE